MSRGREAEMRAAVLRWESSGLSGKAFAEREGLPYRTFLAWRRWLSRPGRSTVRKAAAPVLEPVRVVPDEPVATRAFEVRLAERLVVSVPPGFDASELQRLLSVLSRC